MVQLSGVCLQGPLPCGHSCPEGRRLLEGCWGRGRAEAATFLGQGDLECVWGRAGGGAAVGSRRRRSRGAGPYTLWLAPSFHPDGFPSRLGILFTPPNHRVLPTTLKC